MSSTANPYRLGKHTLLEKRMKEERRRQAGIAFPSPGKQDNVLIVRLDIRPVNDSKIVREGLKRLCTLIEEIESGFLEMQGKIDRGESIFSSLSRFDFTGTIGFGRRFFEKLNLMEKCPKYLYDMPNNLKLGDPLPYVLQQTDMILQLASNNYSVNRLVLQNDSYLRYSPKYHLKIHRDLSNSESQPLDILTAVLEWAKIIDVHSGFHRTDGRNLMGFYDGLSNPDPLINDVIWISEYDEEKDHIDGTYMVFQKIEHDLREWHRLDIREQERWVGRTKATGLLLGTLTSDAEKRLLLELDSTDPSRRTRAIRRLTKLTAEQRDPQKRLFDSYDPRYMKIYKSCPINSHVRKANPRQRNGKRERLIFRRGYLYVQEEFDDYLKSGLLFISFQKDVRIFEDMKKRMAQQTNALLNSKQPTGKEDYSGHSVLVKNPFNLLTLGGGYYFIPPIPNRKISEIGQQFF